MEEQIKPQMKGSKIIAAAVGAWLIFLSIDFLLHAVILATWWKKTADFWLSPEDLFRMIPIGYLSFAIYCGALTWLFVRIFVGRRTIGTAFGFGAIAGLVYGVSTVLANYAVFVMPRALLLVWSGSILIESTFACATASWVLDTERSWRRVGLVFGAAVLIFILSVVLQNLLYPT
jgi:hypothetical protein